MDEKQIIKKYKNKDLTVIWKPKTCIHAAVCVEMLPNVYDPNAKPWINAENASAEELIAQIDKCPSGALSYELETATKESNESENISIDVAENGPILVKGKIKITHASGKTEFKDKTTAFCRCGASSNKPYCDGMHKKINFEG